MSQSTIEMPAGERVERRILGRYGQNEPGPTLLVQGGIHGNEPGGVEACKRVLAKLGESRPSIRGEMVAVVGNLGALAQGERFLDRDLNRLWLQSTVQHLEQQDPALDCTEDREQRELLTVYQEVRENARGPLVFVDLHSSSADGPPFSCLADTLANRQIALALPIPMILGLEEAIDGAVMDYFTQRGLVSLAVEGGRHEDPSTVDNLEAAIWLTLVATGLLDAKDVDVEAHRATLRDAAKNLPPVVEIRHRQVLKPDDGFRMAPGWESFEAVTKGEVLATDHRGEIRATESGRMLLPLYQGQGEDGFFLCRDVSPFWLGVAKVVRRLKLDRIAHWMPGVTRSKDDPNMLVVNPKVARWFVVEIFHLLGFRRRRTIGGKLTFTRRRTEPAARKTFHV